MRNWMGKMTGLIVVLMLAVGCSSGNDDATNALQNPAPAEESAGGSSGEQEDNIPDTTSESAPELPAAPVSQAMGQHTITDDGSLIFSNGVSIGWQGQVMEFANNEEIEEDGETVYLSMYMAMAPEDEEFAYMAMMFSGENIFDAELGGELVSDEDFREIADSFSGSMLGQLGGTGIELTELEAGTNRTKVTSSNGTEFTVGDLKYNMQDEVQNVDITLRMILSADNLVMVMVMEDMTNGSGIASAVLDSIAYL